MKRRILVLFFLVLALLITAACSRNEDDELTVNGDSATQDQQETPSQPQENDPASTPQDEPELDVPSYFGVHAPRDFGGRTLRIQSWFGGAISYTEGLHYGEPDPATSSNYFAYRMRYDNFRRVQEEFNFTLEEVIISPDYMISTLLSSVLAGAPLAELVRLGGGDTATAIMGDLIIPLSGVDLPGSDLLGPQLFSSPMVEFQGDIWTMNDSRPDLFAFVLGVNLDIINEIGAQNPVDLHNAGQWNWDAMLEIMRLATADTTGDGQIDRFGLGGQPSDVLLNMIGANDGVLVTDDLNYGFDHPNTIEALEFIQLIFNEGLFDHDPVAGFNPGDWGRNFWQPHAGDIALFNAVIWGLNNGDLPFDFAIVPWPAGPSNTSGAQGIGGWREGVGIIAGGTEWAPADLLIAVEEFYAWSGGDVDLMNEDALGWPRAVFPTEEDVIRTLTVANNLNRDLGLVVAGYTDVIGGFASAFFDNSATVMQLIEEHRPPQQEMLDYFFR